MLTDLNKHGRELSDEEFAAVGDYNFTAMLSNGEEVELCDGGQEKKVNKENLSEYINLVVKARFSEATE